MEKICYGRDYHSINHIPDARRRHFPLLVCMWLSRTTRILMLVKSRTAFTKDYQYIQEVILKGFV
jgi:hypothetical protein